MIFSTKEEDDFLLRDNLYIFNDPIYFYHLQLTYFILYYVDSWLFFPVQLSLLQFFAIDMGLLIVICSRVSIPD